MDWLRRQKPGGAYDLVVVDPPTFSNSKRTDDVFDVQRDAIEMLGLIAGLVAPGGVVYFSNNNRRFKLDEAAVVAMGFSGREISRRTVPPEYRNQRIHRCWRLVRESGEARGGVVQEEDVD